AWLALQPGERVLARQPPLADPGGDLSGASRRRRGAGLRFLILSLRARFCPMRAAYIEATGGPEVIKVGELPNPEPGPGQVQGRVRAVSLNPINLYIRSGMVAMPMTFPYIIASDLAGTVEKVGPKVTRFKAGDRVWGSNQGLLGRPGVAAELAAVDEEWL